MNPSSGVLAALFALLPLAGCGGGAAAPSAAPATSTAAPATSAPAGTSAPASPASSASSNGTKSYTLADVATHNTRTDCWAAINAEVFDLTQWISRHPGGPDKIVALCGTDATTAFSNQHDGQARPNTQLAGFKVGDLSP